MKRLFGSIVFFIIFGSSSQASEHQPSDIFKAIAENDNELAGELLVLFKGLASKVFIKEVNTVIGPMKFVSAPLSEASLTGKLLMVQLLLENNASPNEAIYGKSALMLAAAAGHTDVVIELLAWGAKSLYTDISGQTALHKAVIEGRVETAKELLGSDAVRMRDTSGKLPKDYAKKKMKALFK